MTQRTKAQLLSAITPATPASWTDVQLVDLIDSIQTKDEHVLVALVNETYATTSEVLQESDELRFPVKAGEMWWFETTLMFKQQNGNTGTIGYAGADLTSINWTYLTGPTATSYRPMEEGGSPAAYTTPVAVDTLENANDGGILNRVVYGGRFVAAEDGEFIFAYAHGSGGSDALEIHPGTHIRAFKLGVVTP